MPGLLIVLLTVAQFRFLTTVTEYKVSCMLQAQKASKCSAFVVNDFLLSNTRVCFNIDGTPGYGGYGNHYEPS